MQKLLIADDEPNIREGLQSILDWKALGIEIVAEASDGQEALNMIMRFTPDIVIIDIRMPKLSGLEVICQSQKRGYTGNFIILSGYSDFNYAKQAISLGVTSYLTKPIITDELKATITEILDRLASKKNSVLGNEKYQRNTALALIKDLLLGNLSPENFPIIPSQLMTLKLSADSYQVVLYENFYPKNKEPFYNFTELLNVSNKSMLFEAFKADGHDIILLRGKVAMSVFKHYIEKFDNDQVQENSPMDHLFIAYGRPSESILNIHQSYEDARFLISRRFFCQENQHILGFEDLPNIELGSNRLSAEAKADFSEKISNCLITNNRTGLAESLYELSSYLYNVENRVTDIRMFVTDIYFNCMDKVKATYSNVDLDLPQHSQIISKIGKMNFLYEIFFFFSTQFDAILKKTGCPDNNSIVEDVKHYLKHNFCTNIHLETIAPLFGYNPCYLGRLFKQTTGETFNNYLDKLRIDKALELLKDDSVHIYQISDMIGYSNVEYFYSKFKKMVGDTPSNYRRKNLYE